MSDSIRLTLKTVQTDLRAKAPDMTIRKTDCGEYRITFTQSAILAAYPQMTRNEAIAKAESLAAYESDICEAYETAKSMARVGLAPEQATSEQGAYLATRAIADSYVAAMAANGVKVESFASNNAGLFFVLHVSGDFGLITNDAGHVFIPALKYWHKPAPEQATESDAARMIVKRALNAGYKISVNDGEETTIRLSCNADIICAALATTDQDILTLWQRDDDSVSSNIVGHIVLIWGNGPDDLVHDCTDNAATLAIVGE